MLALLILSFSSTCFAGQYPTEQETIQKISTLVNDWAYLTQDVQKYNKSMLFLFPTAITWHATLESLVIMMQVEIKHGLKNQADAQALAVINEYVKQKNGQNFDLLIQTLDDQLKTESDAVFINHVERTKENLRKTRDLLNEINAELEASKKEITN